MDLFDDSSSDDNSGAPSLPSLRGGAPGLNAGRGIQPRRLASGRVARAGGRTVSGRAGRGSAWRGRAGRGGAGRGGAGRGGAGRGQGAHTGGRAFVGDFLERDGNAVREGLIDYNRITEKSIEY